MEMSENIKKTNIHQFQNYINHLFLHHNFDFHFFFTKLLQRLLSCKLLPNINKYIPTKQQYYNRYWSFFRTIYTFIISGRAIYQHFIQRPQNLMCMWTHKDEESKEMKFIEIIQDNFLYQHVTLPTRCRGTDQPSTIDLVSTNEEQQIGNLNHFGKSDHCIPSFEFICEFIEQKALPKYKYLPINGNRSQRFKLKAQLFS